MKKWVTAVLLLFVLNVFGQKEELRGAWIATYTNIDFPVRGQSPQQQQAHFIRIIDALANSGFNSVYVQVRSQADAMYPSPFEPWSADLTGIQGRAPDPYWDPLQFMIEACHARGIEFHAWINPYRVAGNSANLSSAAPNHISRTEPGWLLRYGSLVTLDPGIPAVRDHIIKVVSDITRRYDIDGIHFDDYFYPDPAVNDNRTFTTYNRGFVNRADWRRDNVDLLINEVSKQVRSIKSWVKFGVSPSGIYRNSRDYSVGTPTTGLEHYTSLYSDTRKWLREGWIDYLEPQVYWSARQPGARFGDIVPWWNSIAGNRHMYIGLAAYKVERGGSYGWSDPSELPSQVLFTRQQALGNIKGHAVYNTSSILGNNLGLFDSLKRLYAKPAIVPEMPWLDSEKPLAPHALAATLEGNVVILNWELPKQNSLKNAIRKILVYASDSPSIHIQDPESLIAVLPPNNNSATLVSSRKYFAITVIDRTSNESGLSNTASPGVVSIPFTLVDFTLEENESSGNRLSWQAANELSISKYEIEKSVANGPYSLLASVIPGKGSGVLTYSYLDTMKIEDLVVTYRLRIMDTTGNFSYSKPLSVSSKTPSVIVSVPVVPAAEPVKKEEKIYVTYPRPVNAGKPIMLITNDKGDFTYTLYDNSGTKVTWGKIRSPYKGTRVALPGTASLQKGYYLLEVGPESDLQKIRIDIM